MKSGDVIYVVHQQTVYQGLLVADFQPRKRYMNAGWVGSYEQQRHYQVGHGWRDIEPKNRRQYSLNKRSAYATREEALVKLEKELAEEIARRDGYLDYYLKDIERIKNDIEYSRQKAMELRGLDLSSEFLEEKKDSYTSIFTGQKA